MKAYFDEDGITLILGDCREVIPELDPPDHCITDPPYGRDVYLRARKVDSALSRTHKIKADSSLIALRAGAIGAVDELIDPVARLLSAVRRWVLIFSDIESCHLWREALAINGLRYVRTGAWIKPDAMPQMTGDRPGVGFEVCTIAHAQGAMRWNGGGHAALWTHNTCKVDRPDHPCPKPLALMGELVSLFTDLGDMILDPFAGSCTTAVAAKQLGRRCICVEREEKYLEIGAKRLSQSVLRFPPAKPAQLTLQGK